MRRRSRRVLSLSVITLLALQCNLVNWSDDNQIVHYKDLITQAKVISALRSGWVPWEAGIVCTAVVKEKVTSVNVIGPAGKTELTRKNPPDSLTYWGVLVPQVGDSSLPITNPVGDYSFIAYGAEGAVDSVAVRLNRFYDWIKDIKVNHGDTAFASMPVYVTWAKARVRYGSEPDSVWYEVRVTQKVENANEVFQTVWKSEEIVNQTFVQIPSGVLVGGQTYSLGVTAVDSDGNQTVGGIEMQVW